MSQRSIVTICVAAAVLAPVSTAQFFSAPVSHAAPNPRGLVVANLIGDANIDIATGDYHSAAVTLRRGLNGGGLAAPVTFPVGGNPFFLAAGDLNGDGRLDLITANYDTGTVSVLLRRNNTFLPARTFFAGPRPTCVAVGDLNRDGKADLVVGNFDQNSAISVLLGDGFGGFQLRMPTPLFSPVDALVTGDWNADGMLDVAATNRYVDGVAILFGIGTGDLVLSSFVNVPRPVNLAAGDLNRDGATDLVVATYDSPGAVSVLLGFGGGFFFASQVPVGRFAFSLAIGDVNRDGYADVVVGDGLSDAHNAHVLIGLGQGILAPPTTVPLSANPTFLALADVNRDARLDLVCAQYWTDQISILRGF